MSAIDELKVLDGYIDGNQFILRGVLGHAVYSTHNAETLRSLARLINTKGESFSISIDEKTVKVNKEQSLQLRKEYLLLADELEGTY